MTTFDQLGRVEETAQLETLGAGGCPDTAPSGILTDIRYWTTKGHGCKLQSNPYRTPSSDATTGWTLTQLDTNGRVAGVGSYSGSGAPSPWGSNSTTTGAASTSYSSNVQTVADQAGVTRSWSVDGLGRLAPVTEAGTAVTSYSYDALDDLTSVGQSGLGNRTFVYDSQAWLSSATNPESGTTGCTYDANGNLLSRTDARGVKTTYSVDLYSRVTQKSYTNDPANTPAVTYCYDNATCGGSATAPSINRLTQVQSWPSDREYPPPLPTLPGAVAR